MKLRGITLDHEVVYFDISDVPVILNENMIVLTRREGSPIILAQSIARGTDNYEFFETDFVFKDGQIGVVGFVVYVDGFYIWSSQDGSVMPIRNIDGYRFVPNTQMHRISEMNEVRSKIRFGCGGRRFPIDRIIYYRDGELFITIKPCGTVIRLDSINPCTGLNTDRQELMFGQVRPSGKVVLRDYHPMLELTDGTLRDLEESDYDELGVTGDS